MEVYVTSASTVHLVFVSSQCQDHPLALVGHVSGWLLQISPFVIVPFSRRTVGFVVQEGFENHYIC